MRRCMPESWSRSAESVFEAGVSVWRPDGDGTGNLLQMTIIRNKICGRETGKLSFYIVFSGPWTELVLLTLLGEGMRSGLYVFAASGLSTIQRDCQLAVRRPRALTRGVADGG